VSLDASFCFDPVLTIAQAIKEGRESALAECGEFLFDAFLVCGENRTDATIHVTLRAQAQWSEDGNAQRKPHQ